MKKYTLSKAVAPAAFCAGLCLTGSVLDSSGQVTAAQKKELSDFVGNRAEVGVILGASDSASSGSYTIDGKRGGEDQDFSLMKFGGGGEIGKLRPLGSSGMQWRPVIFGSIGQISGNNDITAGGKKNPIYADKIEESALGLQVGGGMALHLSERWTVTPTVGLIYGHYELDYNVNPAHRAAGSASQNIKNYLDDSADSIGVAPGIGIAYKMPVGKTTLEFSANYTFFGTEDVSDSNLDIGGSSHVFSQKIDADIPLPYELWDCPLHTGGYFSMTEVAGDIGDTMSSEYWATIHGRLLLDTTGKLWKMDRAGLGMSYIMADTFTGWDVGIEVSFKF